MVHVRGAWWSGGVRRDSQRSASEQKLKTNKKSERKGDRQARYKDSMDKGAAGGAPVYSL